MSQQIIFRPIGFIRSPHTKPEETPIQPAFAHGCRGRAEILPEYAAGLKDLEGFSHLYLIYHLHQAGPFRLLTRPFLEDVERGLFATRSPRRPNPIGLSVVELLKVEGSVLHLDRLDMLDGTPLLDIKPYSERFDRMGKVRQGWMDGIDPGQAEARGRRGFKG